MVEQTYSNMTEALKGLERAGYQANFIYETEHLRVCQTGQSFSANDLTIVDIYRFEGPSNPDDMAVLYAIKSKGGLKGTLVDGFGVYASNDIGNFMQEVPDARNESNTISKALPSDIW